MSKNESSDKRSRRSAIASDRSASSDKAGAGNDGSDSVRADDVGGAPRGVSPERWVKRAVLALVAIAVAFIVFQIAASFLPRWWSHRIGAQTDGSFTSGILWGSFYGFVFTCLPLLLLFQVRRRFIKWRVKIAVAVIAVVIAAPNWMTLGIVWGSNDAAHAGQRTLDADAPGFRGATLIAAIIGAALAIGIAAASIRLKQRRQQVKDLRSTVHEHDGDDKARGKQRQGKKDRGKKNRDEAGRDEKGSDRKASDMKGQDKHHGREASPAADDDVD